MEKPFLPTEKESETKKRVQLESIEGRVKFD